MLPVSRMRGLILRNLSTLNYPDMFESSALALLRHEELCEVRTEYGTREARWRPGSRLFFFTDGERPSYCTLDEVMEWWAAGVKF